MDMSRIRPQRIRLMGEPIDLVTPAEVMNFTARKVASGQRAVIANHNVHSLYLLHKAPEMRAFYQRADVIELDSIPLVYWGMLTRKPVSRAHRCTYLDWRQDFWARAVRHGWRVYYLGGAPGVPELAAERIRARHPGAIIGGHHGYFDVTQGGADNAAVRADIDAFRPDVLFVGMGMPRQEAWIDQNLDALAHPPVAFSVGAAFDYEAGVQVAAPRWLSKMGLEWAFRLVSNPKRLFARYMVEPWFLLPAAARDVGLAFSRRGPAPTGHASRQVRR